MLWRSVVQPTRRLACPVERFIGWVEAGGVQCDPLAVGETVNIIHEQDALVSQLYRLRERQVVSIFEIHYQGRDYQVRPDGALRHFRRRQNYL